MFKESRINQELILLNLLLNYNNYNTYKEYLDLKYIKEIHRELYYIYSTLEVLHNNTNIDLTLSDLKASFYVTYPDADKVVYDALFTQLENNPISVEVGISLLKQIKNKKNALKLADKAFSVSQGKEEYSSLKLFFEETNEEDDHRSPFELNQVDNDLEAIATDIFKQQGLRWRLDCLNKSLGSLRQGDFGFIFARPETGKTTFLASEISHMLSEGLRESNGPIIWVNNEEQGNKVMLRVYQAFFGVTTAQLMSNVPKYRNAFMEITHDKFYLFDAAHIDYRQVEKVVSKLNPSLVIYDQLTKIRGFKADRNDLLLGQIFQWARELAKGSHASIGVSQADGSAEGVRYLTMEHVANAKTAVQAEADWILGIGKDHSMEKARFLNISKNKLIGDEDSVPELRHGKFEVLLEAQIARYDDIIKY